MRDKIEDDCYRNGRPGWNYDDSLAPLKRPVAKWYPPEREPVDLDKLLAEQRRIRLAMNKVKDRPITPDYKPRVKFPSINKTPASTHPPSRSNTDMGGLYWNKVRGLGDPGNYLKKTPPVTAIEFDTPDHLKRAAKLLDFIKPKRVQEIVEPLEGAPKWDVRRVTSYIRNNNYRSLEEEIANGMPMETSDDEGNTLLLMAAQSGQKRITKLLLRNDSDINASNYRGDTALHYCAEYGFEALYDYLRSKGADADAVNDAGMLAKQGLGKNLRKTLDFTLLSGT